MHYIQPSRATTLRPRNGLYQCNTRIDPRTHERLTVLQAYYSDLTRLKANKGTIVRRAIRLLEDQLPGLDPDIEKHIVKECAKGDEPLRCGVRSSGQPLNT
ncbi:MAG: hypothetical protein MI892_00975 [Desulfobacterales bacterium]|nr:hypothetical protein [Desulfobacterales bacterium]